MIPVRWNPKIQEWEAWSLVLQGWTCTENVPRNFTYDDVKVYYAQFGKQVQFCS